MTQDESRPDDFGWPAPTWQDRMQQLAAPAVRILGWLRRHPRIMGIAALGVLLVVCCVQFAGWWTEKRRVNHQQTSTIEAALARMDAGDFDEARRIAARLRERAKTFEEQGGPIFILGAVLAQDAAGQWDDTQQRRLYLIAARYLEEGRARGYPEGREGDGIYLLGQCLYRAGHYAECLPVLHEALRQNPNRQAQIQRLLAKAYFRDQPSDLAKASKYNALFLEDKAVSPRARHEALLEQSQVLLALDDLAGAREALDQIPDATQVAHDVDLARAHLSLLETDNTPLKTDNRDGATIGDLTSRYDQIIASLRDIDALELGESVTTRRAKFLIGVVYRRKADRIQEAGLLQQAADTYQAAAKQFAGTRRVYFNFPEGVLAGMQEAELNQQNAEYQHAIEGYLRVLNDFDATPAGDWWSMQFAGFGARIEVAFDEFLAVGDYDRAIQLARAMPPVTDEASAVRLVAKGYEDWARSLDQEAATQNPRQAEATFRDARKHWREAGVAYSRLAELRIATREYTSDLEKSAQAFLQGQNYLRAIQGLQLYLQHEIGRERPTGLLGLGKAYLALGKPDKAMKPLLECINSYPKHPAAYEARLVASSAWLQSGKLDKAQKLLEDNLHNEFLRPQSWEWRHSLFALGDLHYRKGLRLESQSRAKGLNSQTNSPVAQREAMGLLEASHDAFQEAISQLFESIRRYPDDSKSLLARYQIGESHRKAARLPKKRLETETIETNRNALIREIQTELEKAAMHFLDIQERLNEEQQERDLTKLEQRLLRNAYFAHADALFDMGKFEEAQRVYSTASNRYINDPESLEAFLQIANCQKQLGRYSDARGTLEQAKVVLSRIRPEANFLKTTRFSRDQWVSLLDWMTSL